MFICVTDNIWTRYQDHAYHLALLYDERYQYNMTIWYWWITGIKLSYAIFISLVVYLINQPQIFPSFIISINMTDVGYISFSLMPNIYIFHLTFLFHYDCSWEEQLYKILKRQHLSLPVIEWAKGTKIDISCFNLYLCT